MNILKAFAKDSAIYGAANAGTAVLALFLVPVYTHKLTAAEFGTYSLIATVYGLLSILADCGLSSSVARYYFNESLTANPDRIAIYRRRLLSTALLTTGAASFMLSVACYASADFVSSKVFGVLDYGPFVRIVGATLFVRGLTIIPMIYLRVAERPLAYGALTLIQMSLFLALSLIFVLTLDWAVSGIFYSQLLSTTVWALFAVAAVARELRAWPSIGIAKDLLKLGLPLLPALPLMWVIDVSDRYLVERYASMADVGLYSLGYRLGQVMTFLVTAVALGWPGVSFKILDHVDAGATYARITGLYIAGGGLVWLSLSLFSPEAVILLSAKEFHSAAVYVPPVAFAYFLYGLYMLSTTGLGLAKRHAPISGVALIAALVNVGLNIWLIPRFGPLAAAYTTIVAYAILTGGCLFMSQRVYPIPFHYRQWALMLGGMIILAGIPSVLPSVPWHASAAIRLALVAIYGGLICTAGVLQKHELLALALSSSRIGSPSPSIGASASS